MKLKLRVRPVTPEEYRQPLAALAGLLEPQPAAPADAAALPEEMLLLSGLNNQQLNALLRGFRTDRIEPVALKAILTPTNSSWDSITLYQALLEEHAAMQQGGSAHPQS